MQYNHERFVTLIFNDETVFVSFEDLEIFGEGLGESFWAQSDEDKAVEYLNYLNAANFTPTGAYSVLSH